MADVQNRSRTTAFQKIGMLIDRCQRDHVASRSLLRGDPAPDPAAAGLGDKNDLLSLDPDKPLVVRETPTYQRGVAGASIEAPGPYRPQDRTYYNVTPLDGLPRRNRPRAACANTTTGSCRS